MSAISIFDAYETDTAAEEAGKWFTDFLGPESGADIMIRRAHSQHASKVRAKLFTANRKHLSKGKFPPEIQARIDRQFVAEALIAGWRGINDRDGSPIPYSVDAAVLVLEKLPNFQRDIELIANSLEAFRVETREEVAGN